MCPNCICSIIPSNTLETQQCSIPLDLPKRSLLADVNPSGCRSFGRSLLPWLGAITNEHMITHLPLTLATTAESKSHGHTTKVPGSPAEVVLDSGIALDYLLTEQGGVCAIANTSCCSQINISGFVETPIQEMDKQAPFTQADTFLI